MIGPFPMDDPFDSPNFPPQNNNNNAAMLAWQERQRRQRTVRLMMMFVMMLLLMDGEDPSRHSSHSSRYHTLRKKHKKKSVIVLDKELYEARVDIDERVKKIVLKDAKGSAKREELRKLNDGVDVEEAIRMDVENMLELESLQKNKDNDDDDDDDMTRSSTKGRNIEKEKDDEDEKEIYHFPRNATGYYRGEWTQIIDQQEKDTKISKKEKEDDNEDDENKKEDAKSVTSLEIQSEMERLLNSKKESIGVILAPPSYKIDNGPPPKKKGDKTKEEEDEEKNIDNDDDDDYTPTASSIRTQPYHHIASQSSHRTSELSLTQSSGRIALQLYSRFVPGMEHLSLIEGLIKLYDGPINSGFGSRRDVLLRVYGVVVHGIGRVSMVSSIRGEEGRSALVLKQDGVSDGKIDLKDFEDVYDKESKEEEEEERRRRLEEKVTRLISYHSSDGVEEEEDSSSTLMGQIRDEALSLYFYNDFLEIEDKHDDDGYSTFSLGLVGGSRSAGGDKNYERKAGWTLQTFEESWEEDGHWLGMNPSEEMRSTEEEWFAKEHAVHDWFNVLSSPNRRLSIKEEPTDKMIKDTETKKKKKHKYKERKGTEDIAKIDIDDPNHAEEDVDAQNEEEEHGPSSENSRNKKETVPGQETEQIEREISIEPDKPSSSSTKGKKATKTERKDATYLDSFLLSKSVLPFPYVPDDEEGALKKYSPLASKRIPPRDLYLEGNAAYCEFEINLDIKETTWTMGEMRDAMEGRLRSIHDVNPAIHKKKDGDEEEDEEEKNLKRGPYGITRKDTSKTQQKKKHQEALVMGLTGTIISPNCDFASNVNVTAIRMNWEHTTGKAINYSFFMMLTCLTQIILLLRQLLHSQAQSTAIRVSLLCIGWQTVLDAILCIGHIFLCLVMQPLFTAFASVAFFKLLIFCVIEMKYMAIITQARNNANNEDRTAEDLRRQITVLHLRFYVALMAAVVSFWYIGQTHRILYILLLYSFWVPQIVQNIITEAKKPLHLHYITGMSVTRLVAPLYIFAVPGNFLKEVNPDFPQDGFMCYLLVLWVGLQAVILVMQGKYGTRFMIPARFLPPKFDYSRPIPPSLMPQPETGESSNRVGPGSDVGTLLGSDSPSGEVSTTGVTRNRIKGNRSRSGSHGPDSSNGTTTIVETTNDSTGGGNTATLDCVICYNSIDITDRRGYMLAPCDHIFHRDCLEQWMEVKMECPICRKDLPAL